METKTQNNKILKTRHIIRMSKIIFFIVTRVKTGTYMILKISSSNLRTKKLK